VAALELLDTLVWLDAEKRQPTCPCCGTLMVVLSESETKVTLKCPACQVSDIRMK